MGLPFWCGLLQSLGATEQETERANAEPRTCGTEKMVEGGLWPREGQTGAGVLGKGLLFPASAKSLPCRPHRPLSWWGWDGRWSEGECQDLETRGWCTPATDLLASEQICTFPPSSYHPQAHPLTWALNLEVGDLCTYIQQAQLWFAEMNEWSHVSFSACVS